MSETQKWLIADEDKTRVMDEMLARIIEQNEYIVELEMQIERLHSQLIIAKTRS